MADDDTTPKPENPERPAGRSLRARARTSSVAENEAAPDLDDDEDDGDPGSQVEENVEAAVCIWNHTHGIRPGVHSEPSKDGKGNIMKDGAGMPTWVTISVQLQPGLNLVPKSAWAKIREGLRPRIRAGEIEHIPTQENGELNIKAGRLVRAIAETGSEDVLRSLAEHERKAKVVEALEAQIDSLRRGGGAKLTARRLQQVHTVR